jgi:DNA-binding IclR family transcriptional regulator
MVGNQRVSVKSADRVLDTLELLSRRGRPMSHSEIALEIGIPKSSLTQLLRNLTGRGYLAFNSTANTYELGSALFALVQREEAGANLVAIAQPILNRLTARTNESSSFNIYIKDEVERICGVDSPHALTYRMAIGLRYPLYSTSGGKAVLACLPEIERERYLKGARFERRTAKTLKSVNELRRDLARIAKGGFAYSNEEETAGIVGLARPVLRPDGYPVGALIVVTPIVRFHSRHEKLCEKALKEATDTLERELRVCFHAGAANGKTRTARVRRAG